MKYITVMTTLLFSWHLLAVTVEMSSDGKKAVLRGGEGTTVHELVRYVYTAHELGLVDRQGRDSFKKIDRSQGAWSSISFLNKYLSAEQELGFVELYSSVIRARNPAEIFLSSDRKMLILTGEAGGLLKDVINVCEGSLGNHARTRSGQISCKTKREGKVTCVIKIN